MNLVRTPEGWSLDIDGLTKWEPRQNIDKKCSLCMEIIKEEDVPVLLWDHENKEICLHTDCFKKRLVRRKENESNISRTSIHKTSV